MKQTLSKLLIHGAAEDKMIAIQLLEGKSYDELCTLLEDICVNITKDRIFIESKHKVAPAIRYKIWNEMAVHFYKRNILIYKHPQVWAKYE